jgi:hypothetical protein
MKDAVDEDASKFAINLAIATAGVIGLGAVAVYLLAKEKRAILHSSRKNQLSSVLITLSFVILMGLKYFHLKGFFALGVFAIGVWGMGSAIALLSSPLWEHLIPESAITPELGLKKIKVSPLVSKRSDDAFIGVSLVTGEAVRLVEQERAMHTLVCGSTGSGKTTALKAFFIDAMKKNQPVLIIDPKGNSRTINEFREIARSAGRSSDRFKVFSIINPDASSTYNPLGRGTSMQVRDRIMGAFEWSEPFYKHQASAWLGLAIDLLKALKIEITIQKLHRLLIDPKEIEALEDGCSRHADPVLAKELQTRLRTLAKYDRKNLDGLSAQLRDLDNLEFGKILNPENSRNIIELRRVLENREVAYFQLNTMAYEGAAKAIGRLILQDLKSLASEIHGSEEALEPVFFPIFVDEFGSFAFEGFVDFLKMSRDVKFANHLFFQSLADLDVVSPEFKSQVQQNCLTKIVMRTDDPDEVDFWSGVAGTRDAVESSYQVESVMGMRMKTGAGNMRYTKQMRIEHDVFKRLRVGQAVLIQKSPAREDLVQLWMPAD